MTQWFLGLGAKYGVDPFVFGAIYVGAIPLFLASVTWLVRNARGRRPLAPPAIAAGFFFVSAYLYLIVAGHDVPAWVYGALGVLVTASAVSTVRSVRRKLGAAGARGSDADTDTDADDYDIVVIGGGSAGLTAAGMSAQLGAKTLLVEKDKLGGDCTWTGCIPSKALLKAAKVREHARTAARYGLEPAELRVDLAKVLGRVHAIQERVYEEADRPEIIASFGVEVRTAEARFTGPHTIELATRDGKSPTRVRFRRAVIASGSAPMVPAIDGLAAVAFITNETIFRLEELPARLVVLGGGPIGVEMAQAFRRLGSCVTVLQRDDAILPKDDRELAALLRARLESEGVRVMCGVKVTRVERAAGAPVRVAFEHEGAPSTVDADAILVATGRAARVTSLGLDAAGVRTHEHGITIDARCRTSQRHIYACGDVTGELQFTHMAEHMAKVAITNALLGWPSKIDRAGVPWVTFTDPELAHVGARRADLDRAKTNYRVYRFPFTKIDRAVAESATEGWVHVLTTPRTGRILGATILGEGAGEMIAELALARKHGIPLRKIADTIHAYPTLALGNRRVADQWYVQSASPLLVRVLRVLRGLHGKVPPPPDRDRIV